MLRELAKSLFDPLPVVFWSAVGALVTAAWQRYRNRMSVLRWQASHNPFALSLSDPRFGAIEVRFNGEVVPDLFVTTIDVQNDSNKDLADLELNVVSTVGTVIYLFEGLVLGSANALLLTDRFMATLRDVRGLAEDDPKRPVLLGELARRRDFRVPALNRRGSLRIMLVVQAPPGAPNHVKLSTDTPGVRVVEQGPRDLVFGVERSVAVGAGLAASVTLFVVLLVSPLDRGWLGIVALLLGALSVGIGVLLVKGARWMRVNLLD